MTVGKAHTFQFVFSQTVDIQYVRAFVDGYGGLQHTVIAVADFPRAGFGNLNGQTDEGFGVFGAVVAGAADRGCGQIGFDNLCESADRTRTVPVGITDTF